MTTLKKILYIIKEMYFVKRLNDEKIALKIIDFLLSTNAFEHTWTPGEPDLVRKGILGSLNNNCQTCWYIEDKGKIIGAMGVRENDYRSGGYEMDENYLAVHKDYRRRGLGSQLMGEVEKYVKEHQGRFILIDTCDTDLYKPARAFFEKHGYRQVGTVPDYYINGEGRIDYFKELKE